MEALNYYMSEMHEEQEPEEGIVELQANATKMFEGQQPGGQGLVELQLTAMTIFEEQQPRGHELVGQQPTTMEMHEEQQPGEGLLSSFIASQAMEEVVLERRQNK